MSEADEFCECGTEVDQIHCQVCGRKVASLHDYNATLDMVMMERDDLRRKLSEVRDLLMEARFQLPHTSQSSQQRIQTWLEQNRELNK